MVLLKAALDYMYHGSAVIQTTYDYNCKVLLVFFFFQQVLFYCLDSNSIGTNQGQSPCNNRPCANMPETATSTLLVQISQKTGSGRLRRTEGQRGIVLLTWTPVWGLRWSLAGWCLFLSVALQLDFGLWPSILGLFVYSIVSPLLPQTGETKLAVENP